MKLNRELHHIQRHIIKVLGLNEWARYKDLKLPGVESSLYNYHLRQVMQVGLAEKVVGKGYRLTPSGLKYVDHVSIATFEPRWQPKIINTFVIKNEHGQVLTYRKMRQPFINQINLPSGKVHYEDSSVLGAAERELGMILGPGYTSEYCGVLDFTARINNEVVSHAIYFIHAATVPADTKIEQHYTWGTYNQDVVDTYVPHFPTVLALAQSKKRGFLEFATVYCYQ